LLDWCEANGIRIHPSLRVLHHDHDKKGICVCAADAVAPILPEQSRKSIPLLTTERDIRSCWLTTSVMYLPSSVDVSCRNSEIRRAVRPFLCIGRPYPPRAVRSRCHPHPRLGLVLRTVRPTQIFDCALRVHVLTPPMKCSGHRILASRSRWAGYLKSLPSDQNWHGIALFWGATLRDPLSSHADSVGLGPEDSDAAEARQWLLGTEAETHFHLPGPLRTPLLVCPFH
jgi:hypothetical protein